MIKLNKFKELFKYYLWDVGCSYVVFLPLLVLIALVKYLKDCFEDVVFEIKDATICQARKNRSTLNRIKVKYE